MVPNTRRVVRSSDFCHSHGCVRALLTQVVYDNVPLKCWILARQVGIGVDRAPAQLLIVRLSAAAVLVYSGSLVLELGVAADRHVAVLS